MDSPAATGSPSLLAGKPWGLPAIAAGLAVPLALWGVNLGAVIAEGVPEDLSDAEVIVNTVLNILIFDGAFMAAAVGFAIWRYQTGWRGLGLRPLASDLYWLPIAGAVVAYVGTIVYGAILAAFGLSPEQDVDEFFDSRVVLPFSAVAIVIVAPLAEEIFFRGFVFAGLIRKFGVEASMAAGGLLFALFHVSDGQTALLVPPFAAIGAMFAWLYYRTGSLWASIAAHVIFNFTTFTILTVVELTGSA